MQHYFVQQKSKFLLAEIVQSSPIIDVSPTNGEVFLLDPELGKMIVYNYKGSLQRTFCFALKSSPFIPITFALYGEKLLLSQEDNIVLASPIDGLIFK